MHVRLSFPSVILTAAVPLLAIACLSCSSKMPHYPVHGKVLYKGQPAEGVLVTLHPKGASGLEDLRPGGETEEDGTFVVKTRLAEGAPAGEYVATFVWLQQVGGKEKKKGFNQHIEHEDRFKGAYSQAAKSKFQVEVQSGPNELSPFELQ